MLGFVAFLRKRFLFLFIVAFSSDGVHAQSVEQKLLAAEPIDLFRAALDSGNAARGAILFHGPWLGCAKCHSVNQTGEDLLGPNLAKPRAGESGAALVESVLHPSKKIAPEYQSVRILTEGGRILTGMVVGPEVAGADELVLRHLETLQDTRIPKNEIADRKSVANSVMPEGLMKSLANQSEFLDLIKYLVEIRDAGPKRARELQPNSAQLAIKLPEYEANIDHAGMIADWDASSLERGKAIYMGLCVNCHGTKTAPGSLATALRFAEGKFKHGHDPYSIYQTITRGAGLMLPQPWMVPQQKYDVIHYLRSEFLERENPSQFFDIDQEYLRGLPEGSETGPEPRLLQPWALADYGPRLINTYEIGSGARNIAQKGIAIQLDSAPGGVAHGNAWVVFDHDTLRVAGVWTNGGFIDWQGIHFDGKHGIHPHTVGDVLLANPTGPGWGHPDTGSLEDDQRVLGRDGKRYGPLPRQWAQYQGLYQAGSDTIVEYRVGDTNILESFEWRESPTAEKQHGIPGMFARNLSLGRRSQDLQLVVASANDGQTNWRLDGAHAVLDENPQRVVDDPSDSAQMFNGQTYYQVDDAGELDMFSRDFTWVVEAMISGDGTLVSRAPRDGPWAPGGQTLFVRDGRLCFDVGWVGVVRSEERIEDERFHQFAMTWKKRSGLASLWIDGERVAKKKLQPKARLSDAVLRFGYTSKDFPATSMLESGAIRSVSFYSDALNESQLSKPLEQTRQLPSLQAHWSLNGENQSPVESRKGPPARLISDEENQGVLLAGFRSSGATAHWKLHAEKLLLNVPAGEPVELTVWCVQAPRHQSLAEVQKQCEQLVSTKSQDRVKAEPQDALFPETITTEIQRGEDRGGFAVDVLQIPTVNPWQARVRLSGLDFYPDGDRMAVCTWDGDVWIVSGLAQLDRSETTARLQWRRVGFGLFQPLGLKIIDGTIYLTCRDQLVRLEDRNGDGEIDAYRCVNNDHQVTEHFHEFAMGLQTDAAGNFYYAKSARHARTALVPHHGTLLRVSRDGERTDILARGFRAANGVCLNPDGSFIVTDQEGHWNPKNRINWVREGGFYGNMYGYHSVTDESDDAMDPPLCWITNKFDRSPSELLWVDSDRWGPLKNELLNFSYGYGKIYVVPHETLNGQVQGGMCQLPIEDLPTGTMRARFSPVDGQLYVCGLSAWGTNQMMQEGGLYRIRYTGTPAALPVGLSALKRGIEIEFSESLGAATSLDASNYGVDVWSLKRSKNYGSDHYDERTLEITQVTLSEDRKRLTLHLPMISPTWCMEIRLNVVTADGRSVQRILNNTIYHLR